MRKEMYLIYSLTALDTLMFQIKLKVRQETSLFKQILQV